ncbi:MAG TPA: cobaltochelatase subunit CobT, partial [Caulobacteraceae bacterium]
MSQKESPTEVFKRALAHAARSLAEQPDLEVVFSVDGPSLTGHRAVLPHPPRELSGPETSRIRGLADQLALRVAHHDGAVHAKSKPQSLEGGQIYDALEQARIEAIGANALAGVRDNLAAVLEQSALRKGYNHIVDPATAPMADIVALIARERLTGAPPPPAAKAMVDLFRDQIEAKAGADLDRLTGALDDQKTFARIARAVIRDLQFSDDLSDAPDQDTQEDDNQEGEPEASGEGEGEEEAAQGAALDDAEKSLREGEAADSELSEADDDDSPSADDDLDISDGDKPARPDIRD